MSREANGTKRRWAAATVAAGVMLGGVIALLRIPSIPAPGPVAPMSAKPAVELARPGGADRMLNDEAVMQDQTPLFLPTERNVSLRPPRRPEAGRTVIDQDITHLSYGENELKLRLPAPEKVAEWPVSVLLADPAASPTYGLGRSQLPVEPFPARGAFVDVLEAGSNKLVMSLPLDAAAVPSTPKPWRPVEYLGRIGPAGLAGPLVISQRSDVDEVDAHFRNLLVRTVRIGERLAPGFYRIVVGP